MAKPAPKFIRVSGQLYRLALNPMPIPVEFAEAWRTFDTEVLSFAEMKRNIRPAVQQRDTDFFANMKKSADKLIGVLNIISKVSAGFAGRSKSSEDATTIQPSAGVIPRRAKMAKKALPKYIRVRGHVYKLRTAQTGLTELMQGLPHLKEEVMAWKSAKDDSAKKKAVQDLGLRLSEMVDALSDIASEAGITLQSGSGAAWQK